MELNGIVVCYIIGCKMTSEITIYTSNLKL